MIPGFFAGGAMGGGTPSVPAYFFSSDPMTSPGWEVVSGPSGFYESGADKTYIAWQFVGLAGYKGVHVAAYDHGTNTWSERVTAGNFLLVDDDHGHPALVRDASGYIHCFFGSHNNTQKYSVSNNPDDITSWTARPDISTALTYPKPVLVGSTLYLFVRDSAVAGNLKLAMSTMTPAAGVGTFSALTQLVDFGAGSRVYTTEAHAIGTDIHFCCMYANSADTMRENVYYYVLDTTTGDISNFDGSTTITAGSRPVTLAQSNANFKIFDHGSNDGDVPSLQFDSSGNAHVMFADGLTPTYDLKHMMLSGGSWSSPVTIATIADSAGASGYVASYCLVPGASGKMEAWYNVSGDKIRRVRSAAGTWASAATISVSGTYDFMGGAAIKDAHPDFRAVYSEWSGSALDSGAANLGIFGYGDGGPINTPIDMSAVDPAGWSNVVLLLNTYARNGSTAVIDDSKSSLRVSFSGNTQVSTAQTPFAGQASISMDGTADFINVINNSAYSVAGTSDFSMDLWVRLNETGRVQMYMAKRPASGSTEFSLYQTATNQVGFLMWGAGNVNVLNLTGTTALTTGVWYYVECNRISSVTYLLYGAAGGTALLEASGTQSAAPVTSAQALIIGRDPSNSARDFNGWIYQPRFTRAGRHSSAFTVPTTPAPRR